MSKSEQLKRKHTKPIKLTYSQKVSSASEEESDLFYLVKFVFIDQIFNVFIEF